MDVVKFGSFLKKLRKEHGLTQEELAEKLGVTNRTVSRWETGTNIPDVDVLIYLSELYQVDLKELLDGEKKEIEHKTEDTQIVRQVVEYEEKKEEYSMRGIFLTVVMGVSSVASLFYTTSRFFKDVIGGGEIVLISLIVAFLIYNISMQGFKRLRNAYGYRITLTGGFLAILLSDILILWLFFGGGSYHNYGILGLYIVLGIEIVTFVLTAILTQVIVKRKAK
ncbi:MAG: helix-turn-helix transcriptional regulator [Clostridia bacterium]|nr:helix-turn-helix transcriptional regulator [Clostridia bacterium]